MTLGEKQRKFTKLVAQLISFAYGDGFEFTFGEAYRTPEQAALNAKSGAGITNSLHTKRLAVDLNLFIEGVYQTDSAAYKPLGVYWKALDPECAWGGDFSRPDGNHFSLSHDGVK
jgi:D-alanyl-D-alanine carboxypeptidase